MARPSCITVNLEHVAKNCQRARQLHGGQILAVVKANAYGHGDVVVAKHLQPHCDGFAVACLEEAITLRENGITQPIILLEGPFSNKELDAYRQYQLTPVIHHKDQWQWWQQQKLSQPVWLKIDTGMHRLGFSLSELKELVNDDKKTTPPIAVLMTHFANADREDDTLLTEPVKRFDAAHRILPIATSLANSAAIMLHPKIRGDWARPGLMLYGVDPLGRDAHSVGLMPAMTFNSRVIALRSIDAGESVGYGSLYTAPSTRRIATIACGYADGYPRTAPNGTPVWVNGRIVPLVGRVSMDMITVDVTDHQEVAIDSAVELWGERVNVAEVARLSGTLAYELLCHTQRPQRITNAN